MQENFIEDSATEFPLHDETGFDELNELLDDSWGFWTVLRRTESLQLGLQENIPFWAEEQSEKVLHLKFACKRSNIVIVSIKGFEAQELVNY